MEQLGQRVDGLEKALEALANGQKELVCQVTELVDKLSVQNSGPSIHEMGENSGSQSRRFVGRQTNQYDDHLTHTLSNLIPKTVKLDFPKYDGRVDPISWVYRAEQYFSMHGIPNSDRVTLAAFHLEGDAQLWFQLLRQEIIYVSWDEFKEGLNSRFGPNQFLDHFGELTKLQQTGTVLDYQSKFEQLLAKAGALPQPRQVSCFISGLKDSIRTDVQANRPTSLTMAIGLARLYEAREATQRKQTTNSGRSTFQPRATAGMQIRYPPTQPSAPIKKMTTEELNERRKKGLCFHCNDKYGPAHECKRLFMIQASWEDSDEDEDMEVEDENGDSTIQITPEISLHAMAGLRAPRTMRVGGSLH
ncbi:hypothetical protein LWI29_014052 [Acer saccharum]|uniref:Ty3 transposon capsid-like protein domain-containing protein n=1 Tax=Acer saccharum TaxID=4024 RepID=A0AA39RXA5_ACESA|nr:hypothetical protein LWI29_014052 [Acer saccharum]